MAIDYSLIGRFNQVQPGGLTQAVRGGADLRGQVLQNQAQQFNLQQAPILAERATQKWNQDLANLQAEEQKNIQEAALKQQEIKQKELEAQQKRYTDSMSILGRSLYSVNDDSQIPIVISSLKQMADNNVIDPNVFYNIPGIKEGRMPTVQEAKVISNSLIETKEQLIKEREAAKALADAEQKKIENALDEKQYQLDLNKFNETKAQNRRSNALEWARINKIGTAESKQSESQKATLANQFRDEYDKKSSDFFKSYDSYRTLQALAKDDSGQSDMALIFTYMKTLDPASTVREGEYASAQNAPGVTERVRNQYNKVLEGKLLTPAGREGFVQSAKTLVKSKEKTQKDLESVYDSYAKKYGIDPEMVVGKKYSGDLNASSSTVRKTKSGLTYEVIP